VVEPTGAFADPTAGFAHPKGGFPDPTGGFADPTGGSADPLAGWGRWEAWFWWARALVARHWVGWADVALRAACRFLCFAYLAWAQSLHVFDYVWTAFSCPPMMYKVLQIERRPAYFLGFGSWLSACLIFLPPYAGPPLAYALLPWMIVAGFVRPMEQKPAPHSPSVADRSPPPERAWPIFRVLMPAAGLLMAVGVLLLRLAYRCRRPCQRPPTSAV
jgi:hypothetical protein